MMQDQNQKNYPSSSKSRMSVYNETQRTEIQMNVNFDNIEDILDFKAYSSPETAGSSNKSLKKHPSRIHRKLAENPVKLLDLKPTIDKFVNDEGNNKKEFKSQRRFQCVICGSKFYRSTHLHRHMRLHTGAKPYPCPICRKRFSRSDYRSTHLLEHYTNKIHCCFVCGTVYLKLEELAAHCRTHDDSEYVAIEMIRTTEKSDANFKRQLLTGRDPVLVHTAAEEIVSSACITIEKADNSTVEEFIMCVENPMYLPHQQAVTDNSNYIGATTYFNNCVHYIV